MRAADRRGISRLPRRAVDIALVAGLLAQASPLAVSQDTPQPRAELVLQTGHTGPVNALALSPDGRFLVSGSADVTLKIWDTASGNVLRTLTGHDQPVLAVAISPDGRWIASGGADATVRVWNVVTGEATRVAAHSSAVKNVVFSDDGRRLTSLGNNEIKVYDLAGGRSITSVRAGADSGPQGMTAAGPIDQVATALSPNGKLAALGGGFTYKNGVMGFGGGLRTRPLRVIDVATGREVESFKIPGTLSSPTDLTFSPDSRLIVAKFVERGTRDLSTHSSLSVFEIASGREVKKLPSADGLGMGGIAFSADGTLLASRVNGLEGSVTLIDTATWRDVRALAKTGFDMNLGDLRATPLAFSSDGRRVAASLGDGVALFDTATGERVLNLRTRQRLSAVTARGNEQAAADAAMSQAGVDPDMMSQLRETMRGMTGAGSPLGQIAGLKAGSPLNFSPDGRLLTASHPSVVWDLVAGAPQPPKQPKPGVDVSTTMADLIGIGATPIAYSADGRLSAAVSADTDGGFAVVVKDAKTDDVVRRIAVGAAAAGAKGKRPAKAPKGFPDMTAVMSNQVQVSGLAFSARGLVVHYCETDFGKGGGMFGAGGSQECHVVTTDPASGKQLRDLKLDGPKDPMGGMLSGSSSTMSPDGRVLVTVLLSGYSGGGSRFGLGLPGMRGGGSAARPSYTITTTDLESGKKVWETKTESEHQLRPPSVVFSPSGTQLALVTQDKAQTAIKVFDTTTRRELSSFAAASSNVHGMVFSRDGKRLALTYGVAGAFAGSGSNQTMRLADKGEPVVTIHDLAGGGRAVTLTDDAPIVGVAFEGAGRLVATLGEDGNEDLWDAQTGARVATLINLVELGSFGAAEWLVVTPEGLFDGSPGAWQQIMWRFSANTFDVGPVEIFFNELYYPSLLSDIVAGKRPKAPRSLPQIDRRQPDVRLALASPPAAGDAAARTVAVTIDVAELAADTQHPQGSGAQDVRLFRNGTLVKVWHGDVLKGQPRARLEATLPIVAGPNRITAYAFNRDNVKSADAFVAVNGSAQLARKGVSYVIAFGVNEYANPQFNLKYAQPDAVAFAEEARAQGAKLDAFARVEVVSLLDRHATKANFLAALNRLATGAEVPANAAPALARLQRAQPEDAVTIYFAGHGTAKGPRFYLVPHDLGYAGPRGSVGAASVDAILSHSVSDLEIEAAIEGVDSSQVLLVIDACNSGQALEAEERRRGPMNSKGLAQLAYEKGMFILTAAQSYQAALETAQLGHGYLTYALVEEGLKKGLADRRTKDGEVTVREWFDYATDRVPEMQDASDGSRLLLLQDDQAADPNVVRSLQRPRAFYRREVELRPVIVARP